MTLTLATFNVKDLFDESERYTAAHIDAKIACLGDLLARANADVVGLQEVGSAEIVKRLAARLPNASEYAAPIVGTGDARGIRCALITRLPIVKSRVHVTDCLDFPVFHAGDPPPFGARLPLRRGVVHAQLRAGASKLHVLVAHFKSKRVVPLRDANGEPQRATSERGRGEEEMRSVIWRGAESLHLRGVVDGILENDPRASVAVLGDLNDVPKSLTLRVVMGTDIAPLFSCGDMVDPAKRYSTFHAGERMHIDHILVSSELRKRGVSAEFLNDALRDHGPLDDSAPPSIDSDHAPFIARFASL